MANNIENTKALDNGKSNLDSLISVMNDSPDAKKPEEQDARDASQGAANGEVQDAATAQQETTAVNETNGENVAKVEDATEQENAEQEDDKAAQDVVDDDGDEIYESREWSAKARDPEVIQQMLQTVMADNNLHINTTEWVGSISYLLSYIVSLQNRFSLTLPLESLGISTDVFDLIDKNEDGTFEFGAELYELITVDQQHYMSCVTSPSDQSQFERIARELLCSFNEKGRYTLRRTGYRIFVGELNAGEQIDVVSDQAERSLIHALTLNSFELDALAAFAAEVPGVQAREGVDRDGNDIITFFISDDVEEGEEVADEESAEA